MTKTVMTFGDSNTYGTPPAHRPGENLRFDSATRWPCVMQRRLGLEWSLVEAGLPGRTTCLPDPILGAHMDGRIGLRIALESHGPIDLLVIMLGTNDLQAHHGATPEQVVGGLAALLAIAHSEPYQLRHKGFQTLVICPPTELEQGCYRAQLFGAAAKSQALPSLIEALCAHWQVPFMRAGDHIASSPLDGLHFTAEDHGILGEAVAAKIATL